MTKPGGREGEPVRRIDGCVDACALRADPSVTRARPAEDVDLTAVQWIYAHHVQMGTGSFEDVAPSLAEMAARRADILTRGLPYLVVDHGGAVVGFAYAALFRPRSAYRFTVEDSIYIHPACLGLGLGRLLLAALVDACSALGYRQMVAVIGDSANAASIGLHAGFSFGEAGRLKAAGYKFDRWLDVVFMQLTLASSPPS